MRQVQTECRTIAVVSSVLTNTPLRCPSAQWATATQPAGVPPGSPAGAVGGHRLASSDRPIAAPNPPAQGICSTWTSTSSTPCPRGGHRLPAARPATTAMAPPGPAGGDEDLCAAVGRPLRAWPTSKPSMTIGPRPALVCGAAPAIGSPCATPASPACSATWVGDRSRVFGAALAQTGVHHQPTRPCATDQRQHGAAQPHPARPGVTSRRQNSGPVDRAAPPRTTKGGCYARAKRAKTGVVGDRGVSSVGMWPTSKGHVSSTTSWSAASCCSPSLGCATRART